MARSTATNVENNFSKGLITEATGLNFPENACTETYNCIFQHTGEVTRRPGIDYEGSFAVTEQDMDDNCVREYVWRAVALNGEFIFLVLQVGSILNFYQLSTTSLSPFKKDFTVDLNDFKTTGSPEVEPITASFSSGNGYLFVAHPFCEPFYVKYDSDTDDITTLAVEIKIRDFEGVEDNLRDDERPTTLSKEHHYNLLNQGWDVVTALTQNQKTYLNGSPLGWWQVPCPPAAGRSDYPSNCDIWWTSNTVMRPQVDQDGNIIFPVPVEAFFPQEVDKNKRMATRAPNGHFTLTAWHYDRSGVNYNASDHLELPGISGLPVESAGYQRPSSTAFYSGRVWWAGINSHKFNTRIYFSKVIERDSDFGLCYQINDPTGQEAADLVASDGGMIVIPEIASIVKLMQVGSDLYIFATNGTWKVGGSAGTGFLATDHSISKISSTGALSETSFVDVEGTPIWWNYDGIWTVQADPQSGQASIQSLTFTTIDSFLGDIPTNNKRYVKGAYNSLEKIIQWVFRSTEASTIKENFQYDRILNLNLINQSFYPWSFSNDTCNKIVGLFTIQGLSMEASEEDVIDNNGNTVTTGAGNVTVDRFNSDDISTRFKYITTSDCIVDTGTNTITYNPDFLGHLEYNTFGNGPAPAFNGVLVGEDGVLYTYAATDSSGFDQIQRFDGTGALVDYPQATLRSDVETELGNIFDSFSGKRQIIPVPYTAYFYFMTAGNNTDGSPFGLEREIFALYKIDNTGTIVFQGAQGYVGSVFNTNGLADLIIHGISFKGQPLADPTDNEVIFAMTGGGSIIFIGSSATVVNLPSVNTFLANSGEKDNVWTDLFMPSTDTSNMYSRNNINTYFRYNSLFFLPINNGGTWDNLLCAYIPKGEVDYMIANFGGLNVSPIFYAFALDNPNGFVVGRTVSDGGDWELLNSHFKAEDGSDLIPFADLGLNRDGSVGDDTFNDWDTPSVQHDITSGLSVLVWGRHYKDIAVNLSPDGSYGKALVQSWNPTSQSAVFIEEAEGAPWNAVTDMGETVSGGAYPYTGQIFFFLYPDFTTLYFYTRDDGGFDGGSFTHAHYALGKFADITLDLTPQVAGLTFSEFSNINYLDWQASGESEDFTSYFVSGYKVHGDASKKFQANYINLWTRNDDFSKFDFNARWDYAISGDSGRWANTQRVTMDDTNLGFRTKRLKVRGHGKALQYKVNSVTGHPFDIVGWSVWETGNSLL